MSSVKAKDVITNMLPEVEKRIGQTHPVCEFTKVSTETV
jgi:hypothetical protein